MWELHYIVVVLGFFSDYAGIGLTSMTNWCSMIREALAASNRFNSVTLGGDGEIGYVNGVHIKTRKKYGFGDERGLSDESGKKLYLLMMNDLNSQNIQIRVIESESVGSSLYSSHLLPHRANPVPQVELLPALRAGKKVR